jgi:ubiquinone/menaquinone biosynthesis C-methylase UbiE
VGGSGYTVIEAARDGRLAIGCDLSLEGLVVARRLAEAEGVADRTLFVCCSAERLPFVDHAFDVALAIAVIEHVPDDRAAISELSRVLAAGGRAWLTVPHHFRNFSPIFWPPNWLHDPRLGHLRRYDAATLASECRAAGLEPTAVQFTGHSIKVLQIALSERLPARFADLFWWWCERRDLARKGKRRGSQQLSLALRKP